MSLYYEQYEKCKESIFKEQSYNRTRNQRMENLIKQSEQLDEHWKLNYYVVKKAITSDLKLRIKNTKNQNFQKEVLEFLTQQIISEINRTLSIYTPPPEDMNQVENLTTDELNPPQKKRKTSNEVFESKNITTGAILDKLEIHNLCQLYLDIMKFIFKPIDKSTTISEFNKIIIPNELRQVVNYDLCPSLREIYSKHRVLLDFLYSTESDFLFVNFSLENPFISLPFIISKVILEIINSLLNLGQSRENLFNIPIFDSMKEKLILKRELKTLANMSNKFPEILKSLLLPMVKEIMFDIHNISHEKKQILFALIFYLLSECEGVIKIILPDFLEMVQSNKKGFISLLSVLPFKIPDRHGLGILLEIIGENMHQLRDHSFDFLMLFKSIIEDEEVDHYIRDKFFVVLNYVVSILQEDFIFYSSKLHEFNYSADTIQQVSPSLVPRLNSLTFLNSLQKHFEDILLFTIQSDAISESIWFFLLELLCIAGGEAISSNILLHILKSFSFSKDISSKDGKVTIVFLKLYDVVAKNYSTFNEPFIEKVLWKITNSNEQDNCCMVIRNICLWINIMKDMEDEEVQYKSVICYYFITKWQLLYPYLFRSSPTAKDLPILILESFISILKTVTIIRSTEETASITIPEMIANQLSQALIAYYFFLLKPTFSTKHQRRHQLRNRMKASHEIIPNNIIDPDSDIASTLYYYYLLYIVFDGRMEIIESCRSITKEIVSTLCTRFEKVASSVFDFTLDLIFSNHMESRLHATNVFTSTQVHEQINYPLLYHKDALSLVNYFFPDETSTNSKILSNDDIRSEDKNFITKILFKDVEEGLELNTETTESTSKSEHPSLVKQINSNDTSTTNKKKYILDDKSGIRTRGVVFVNPNNVQLKIRNRSFHLKKDTSHHDRYNEEIVKLNKSHILSLFSKCLFSQNPEKNLLTTLQLGKQLMKRLKLQYPAQSPSQLITTLPKKPMTEREIVIDKMFHKFPILYSLIDFISLSYPKKFIELENMELTIISLFANVIGEWNLRVLSNNKGFGSSESDKHLIMKTIQIINIIYRAELIVEPMDLINEIIPYVSPREAVDMLLDIFRFIVSTKTSNANTTPPTTDPTNPTQPPPQQEDYMANIKNSLRKHLEIFAPIYARFTTSNVKIN
ncbi:predicted protein [Naegleria gruberi]|uniref:Predicted protein n=1 Tax=Naegleria gruberi TaxID=5762 RepID=D2VAI6_NAEGR|nr:uncharacterized protein NAEGRDRAFT_65871 [Naegleria gruberi]EFC46080.1 predicted protein [Naegleria gruberi]|eukprot:XP_002678824.1 predicted protein [Naegleria gruberi strain NEG-M]